METIGHAWYLGAILYTMIIAKYLLNKKYTKKVMKYLLPILFIIYILIGKYSKLIFGFEWPYYLRRNFLFTAIPYFYIGYLINENKEKINISNIWLSIIAVILILVTFIEKYVLDLCNLNTIASNYIGISVLPSILFILAIKNPEFSKGKYIATIGRKYATIIYLIHPLIIGILGESVKYYEWLAPIITYLISLFVAIIINKIIERANRNERNLFNR